jgi:hypothetical protein
MANDSKTLSETFFEQFLSNNGIPFEPVPVADSPRPDYTVGGGTSWGPVVFEVKELAEDDDFGQGPLRVGTRKVGDHIRAKIRESRRQIQFGAKQDIPSILLIYNALDVAFHLFGTEDHDFRAAMHGDWTASFGKVSRQILDVGYGRNRSFREDQNTSFTALGHLAPRYGVLTVRLFPNEHAKVPLPTELPPCLEIVR